MSTRDQSTALECRCTRCQYNNNGRCGYQGRVLIDQNGECARMEEGVGPGPGGF